MREICRTCLWGVMVCVAMVRGQRGGAADGGVTLGAEGEAKAVIVLSADGGKTHALAAEELREHIRLMSGAVLSVIRDEAELAGRLPIRLHSQTPKMEPQGYRLKVSADGIHVMGGCDEGLLNGCYDLLEQLGVRWYMPGEFGRVVPRRKTVTLDLQQTDGRPALSARMSGVPRAWARRNRVSGVVPPSSLTFPRSASVEEHPEWYALVGETRVKNQPCVTNDGLIDAMAAAVDAYFTKRPDATWMPLSYHGGRHCECADCQALDPPGPCGPFGRRQVSDRYVWLCNQLLERIAEKWPDKRLALTVVTPYDCPPRRVRGHGRLDVLTWLVGYCRFHAFDHASCLDMADLRDSVNGWQRMLDGDFYERANWGNVAGPGLPFPAWQRYAGSIPYLAGTIPRARTPDQRDDQHAVTPRPGARGLTIAAYGHWASEGPSSWIGAKLLWDPDADVAVLLADFCTNFYGPAAEPMLAYYQLQAHRMATADQHAGSAFSMPAIWDEATRARLRRHLDAAEALAPENTRVAAARASFTYLEAFCAMQAAMSMHDYATASKHLQQARIAVDGLAQHDPPLLAKGYARGYLDRFFGYVVEDGHARSIAAGRMLHGFSPMWSRQPDPTGVGLRDRWYVTGHERAAWPVRPTWTSTWSASGLADYAGDVWYAQTFELMARPEGRVMLWLANVDERAEIWVNGTHVGDTGYTPFKSSDIDVTEALLPNQRNTIVLRMTNVMMDEVGTGGLLGPVMLYIPKATPVPAADE